MFAPGSAELVLRQYIEPSASYYATVGLLQTYAPEVLLVLQSSSAEAEGATGVNQAAEMFPQVPLGRKCFNDTVGYNAVVDFAANKLDLSGDLAKSRYFAFGAAAAVFRFCMDNEAHVVPSSLQVGLEGADLNMQLSGGTLKALEVFRKAEVAQVGGRREKAASPQSLFGILARGVRTRVGRTKLRASLAQPLKDADSINAWLDAVEEMVAAADAAFLDAVKGALDTVPPGIDKVCKVFCMAPAGLSTSRKIAALVNSVLELRDFLRALDALAGALARAASTLLRGIEKSFRNPACASIAGAIDAFIDGDAKREKNSFVNITEQVFAVRPGISGYLDKAREAFLSITESVYEYSQAVKAGHGLDAKVQYTQARGFYLSVPGKLAGRLPDGFSRIPNRSRSSTFLTSAELQALNSRMKFASQTCYALTESCLQDLVQTVAGSLPLLRHLLEALAILDMLVAFAVYGQDKARYARPVVTEASGPLAVVEGRHPIMELGYPEFGPNSTFLCDYGSVELVYGPNMAGKSTYLKQVGLLVVLASCGCFVPAEAMSFAPLDGLLTRCQLSDTSDEIDDRVSSFLAEMLDVSAIQRQIKAKPSGNFLVLVDEIGRSTGNKEGIAFAWALVESLMALRCKCLFATHFTPLQRLPALYPLCVVRQFRMADRGEGAAFTWRLSEDAAGEDAAGQYGTLLAGQCGLAPAIVARAQRVSRAYSADHEARWGTQHCAPRPGLEQAYAIATRLVILHSLASQANGPTVRAELEELQRMERGLRRDPEQ